MVHRCALQTTFPSWFLLRKKYTQRRQKKTFVRIVNLLHKASSSQSDRGDLRKVILASFQLFTFFYTV